MTASTLERPPRGKSWQRSVVVGFAMLALMALMAVGCSDSDDNDDIVCQTGQTLQNGVCVPDGPPSCPPGQTLQNGVCVTGPPSCPPGQTLQNGACVPDGPGTDPGPEPDPGVPPGMTPVAHHGQLKVVGNRIVNQHGRAAQLRGMSLFWSHSRSSRQYYNAAVVDYTAKDWQASVIRAAMAVDMNWSGDEQGFLTGDATNRDRLLTVVEAAIASGIYVIIDWHSYQAELRQEGAVEFFSDMSRRYAGVPNVIYEIYNEPICARNPGSHSNSNPCFSADSPLQYWQSIKPYMQAVTNAIRANDPQNLIIIGTPRWCQHPQIAAADPVTGANLVYSLHFYANSPEHRTVLRERAYQAMQLGKPVFVSEFGSVSADGAGAHNAAETDIWMDFMDQFSIGWANWALHSSPQTSAAISSGQPTQPSAWQLSPSGTYIRNRLRTPRKTEQTFFTVTVNVVGQGEIGIDPQKPLFQRGETVTIGALASSGWTFTGWSGGGLSGNAMLQTLTVNSDIVVTATFTQR